MTVYVCVLPLSYFKLTPLSPLLAPHLKSSGSLDAPSLELVGSSLPTWEFLPWACTPAAIKTPSQCLYVLSQFVLDLLLSYPTISRKPYIFFFFFLLGQGSLWDHRSMTRDGAWGLCSGSRSPYHWTIREFPRKLHYVSNKIVLYPLGVYAVISLEVWSHSDQGGMGPFYLFLVSTYSYLVAQ